MRLSGVVVYDMNDNVLASGDIDHGPRKSMVPTIIVANVQPFVGHYNSEYRRVRFVGGTRPAVRQSQSKDMKRIGGCDKAGHHYYDSHYGENSS